MVQAVNDAGLGRAMWQAFARFARDEDSGPPVRAARFVLGVMMLAAWGLGVRFVLGGFGASEAQQQAVTVFGPPVLCLLIALMWWRCRKARNDEGIQIMPLCPETPPCEAARIGAFVVTYAIYVAWLYGLGPMLALVMQGNGLGILWAGVGGLGLGSLIGGIGSALTHEDPFRAGSFVWSVGVIGLGLYALQHHWVLTDSAFNYHASVAFWLGWMASNAVNLWLQLRGRFRLSRRPVRGPTSIREPRAPRPSRYVRITETLDEFEEGHGIEALPLTRRGAMRMPPRGAPDVVEHDGAAAQITYVRQPDGSFVEVLLPDALPVNRRGR